MGRKIEILELPLGLRADFPFHRLPANIFLLQRVGLCNGQKCVLLNQQLERAPGRAQPSTCIQPRREPETDSLCVQRTRFHARALHQRLHARARRGIDSLKAQIHDSAILILKRHHIRHGSNRRQIDQRHGGFLPAHGPYQFQRNACAAEIAERIIIQQRINHRTFGQHFARAMMIRHHCRKPQRFGQLNQIVRSDAAIHRNQQLAALRNGAHCRLIQAVSFVVTRRQINLHIRAQRAQIQIHDGAGAHAVHIVIAIDADALACIQRVTNA